MQQRRRDEEPLGEAGEVTVGQRDADGVGVHGGGGGRVVPPLEREVDARA